MGMKKRFEPVSRRSAICAKVTWFGQVEEH